MERTIQPPSAGPFRVTLGPALLYLDDIQDVYKGLIELVSDFNRENGNSKAKVRDKLKVWSRRQPFDPSDRVEIRGLGAVAVSIEDLQDATRPELDHLTLVSQSPNLRIDFWRHSSEIIAESDDESVRAFVRGVQDFIRGRRSWPTLAYTIIARSWYVVFVSFVPFALMLPQIPNSIRQQPNVLNYIIASTFLVVFLTVVYVRSKDTVRVVPVWRKDGRRISSQTRRGIVIAFTSSVVAGLLGLWAGLFVHR